MSDLHYFANVPQYEGTQREWELHHYKLSVEEYLFDTREKRKDGKINETSAGDKIIRMHVDDVALALETLIETDTRGRGKEWRVLLREASKRPHRGQLKENYHLLAYIGLLITLQYVYAEKEKLGLLTNIVTGIGQRIEQDMKFARFQAENPDFCHVIQTNFNDTSTISESHKLKTFQRKWAQSDIEWRPWDQHKRAQIGLRVFKCIVAVMCDYFHMTKRWTGKHLSHYVEPTALLNQIVHATDDNVAKRCALAPPCIERPIPWDVDLVSGGYHTYELRQQNKMVKDSHGTKRQRDLLLSDPPIPYIKAINNLQDTVWEVNPFVVHVVETALKTGMLPKSMPSLNSIQMPPYPESGVEQAIQDWKAEARVIHRENKARVNRIIHIQRSLSLAKQLINRPVWFVYSTDFRGRLYCTSSALSPQGEDYSRAMLRFHEGKPLGKEGLRWLAIHGANKYGIDKVPYSDRVQWVLDNAAGIKCVAEEPDSSRSRSLLAGADKPFQFAAFCDEWTRAHYLTEPSLFESRVPVGLDGSCNGLQHYAALLRDEVGGASVNLLPNEEPQDIYGDVATELISLLKDDDENPLARRCLDAGVNRDLTKRSVMVLPYGATRRACMGYVVEYINQNPEKYDVLPKSREVWTIASYLSPLLWEAIKNTITSARSAMDWLQTIAGEAAKLGTHLAWKNPLGFPVCQQYQYFKDRVISTSIFGTKRLSVSSDPDGINFRKSKTAVAPNYIHSVDSCHAVLTINTAKAMGVDTFSFIHDDFGTHAADTEKLYVSTREAFIELHSRPLLEEWAEQMKEIGLEIPPYPATGDLDIEQVRESPYFFG